jgi:hypothetical protein
VGVVESRILSIRVVMVGIAVKGKFFVESVRVNICDVNAAACSEIMLTVVTALILVSGFTVVPEIKNLQKIEIRTMQEISALYDQWSKREALWVHPSPLLPVTVFEHEKLLQKVKIVGKCNKGIRKIYLKDLNSNFVLQNGYKVKFVIMSLGFNVRRFFPKNISIYGLFND